MRDYSRAIASTGESLAGPDESPHEPEGVASARQLLRELVTQNDDGRGVVNLGVGVEASRGERKTGEIREPGRAQCEQRGGAPVEVAEAGTFGQRLCLSEDARRSGRGACGECAGRRYGAGTLRSTRLTGGLDARPVRTFAITVSFTLTRLSSARSSRHRGAVAASS